MCDIEMNQLKPQSRRRSKSSLSRPQRPSEDDDVIHYGDSPQDNISKEIGKLLSVRNKLQEEYDFFVSNDVSSEKCEENITVKRNTSKTDADVINAEIANMAIHIKENVITMPIYNDIDYYITSLESIRSPEGHTKSFSKMKERLRRDDDSKEWLDDAGEAIFHLTTLCPSRKCQTFHGCTTTNVIYMHPFMQDTNNPDSNSYKNDRMSLINLEFGTVKFMHHSLFTLEHVLAECLKHNYKEYMAHYKNNTLDKLINEMKVNRNAREKLKSELFKLGKRKEEVYLDSTIIKYTKRIGDLRKKYYKEYVLNKEIVTKMSLLWSDLKNIRQETGIANTFIVLDITKDDIDEEDFTVTWNENYNSEFTDALHDIEAEYAKKCVEYNIKKHEHKDCITKNHSYVKLSKPKLDFEEDKIKAKIEENLQITTNRQKVYFVLKTDSELKKQYIMNNYHEKERQNKMSEYNYYFRICVDEITVCESEHFSLNNDFTNDLHDRFSVQILPNNKHINISLVENGKIIANATIGLHNVKVPSIQQHTFYYKSKMDTDKMYVGSGHTLSDICNSLNINLKSKNMIKDKFYIKAELTVIVGWNENPNDNYRNSYKNYMDTLNKINKLLNISEVDFDLLNDVIMKTSDTQEMLENVIVVQNGVKRILYGKSFYDDQKIIHDPKNSISDSRFTLLRHRNKENINDINNTIVPLISNQISTRQMQSLLNDSTIDESFVPEEQRSAMEPVDVRRYLGVKYIQIVNIRTLQHLNEDMSKVYYEDIVHDTTFWNTRTIFARLRSQQCEVPNRKRLKMYNHPNGQEIHITLFRGFSLPDRTNLLQSDDYYDDEDDGFKLKQLRPFVRVSYENSSEQTSAAVGCNPTWNQTLILSKRSGISSVVNINLYDEVKEDLTEGYDSEEPHHTPKAIHYRLNQRWLGSLQIPLTAIQSSFKMQGALKINTPPIILGYQNSTDSKLNNNLLHSFYDPILPMQKDSAFITLTISVLPQQSINRFKATHQHDEDELIFRYSKEFFNNYTKEFPDRIVFLTFLGTNGHQKCVVQFLQALPLPDLELFQRDLKSYPRRESALSKSSSSSQGKSGDGKKSTIDTERGDSANTPMSSVMWNGEKDTTSFEMKTLRKEGNQLERVMHICARYVSLVPVRETDQSCEVTLMGWELLKILYGSPLDHAILLASYFLYLGVKCWIICGIGLPRGFSSYVLVKYDLMNERLLLTTDVMNKSKYVMRHDTQVPFIYDAVTAVRYDLRDACCPLKTVHYAFDDENIWINIQLIDSCESVRVDFTRSSDWQTVFNRNVSLSKLPAMSEVNFYTDPEDVETLKQKLENKIKAKVQKWRSHHRTIWNRYCSSVLKDSLSHWEFWALNPATQKPAPHNRLKQLMSTYKIYGFPLNLPYTNMKRILSSIKSTAIFLNDDPSVEFGLAVEIYSYPSSVLSVWIYLATITRN